MMIPEDAVAPPSLAPSLAELLGSAWHDRRILAATFLSFAGIAATLALALPPTYQAHASLAILPSPEYMVRPEAGTRPYAVASLSLDQLMTAETEILNSANLHATVIQSIGLARLFPAIAGRAEGVGDLNHDGAKSAQTDAEHRLMTGKRGDQALRQFDARLTVTASKDANLITIKFSHRRRAVAAMVVNALLRAYADERRDLYADPQTKIVANDVEALSQRAASAEDALADYMTRNDLADFSLQRDLLVKRRDELTKAANANFEKLEEQRMRSRALETELNRQPKTASIYVERDSDQRVADLDKTIADATAKLKLGEIDYQAESRRLAHLNQEVATRQEIRRAAMRDVRPSLERSGPSPIREDLLAELSHLHIDIAAALVTQTSLQQQVSSVGQELHDLLSCSEIVDRLQQQKAVAEESYSEAKRVLAERELTEAEDQLRLARVRVIQDARIPQSEQPWRALIAIAGLFLGSAASIGVAAYRCARRQTFISPLAVERVLGISVLAELALPSEDAELVAIPK